MDIDVKLYKTKSDKVLAVGQATLAKKLVLRLFVKAKKDGTPFVSPPSQQRKKDGQPVKDDNGRDVWDDFWFPITKEFREELYGRVLDAYKALAGGKPKAADDDEVPF